MKIYRVFGEGPEADALWAELAGEDAESMVALDTETTGWVPGQPLVGKTAPQVVCMTLATATWEAYVAAPPSLLCAFATRVLSAGAVIMHNAAFDLSALAATGVDVEACRPRVIDTAVLDWFCDTSREHGLKACARDHLGREPASFEETIRAQGAFDETGHGFKQGRGGVPDIRMLLRDERFIAYAIADARNTYDLHAHLRATLSVAEEKRWHELILPLTYMLWQMQQRGVAVDMDALESARARATADQATVLAKLNALCPKAAGKQQGLFDEAGPLVTNWGSSPQIRELLYGRLGLVCDYKTPKGEDATGVAALNELSKKAHAIEPGGLADSLLSLLLRYRAVTKQLDAFLIPLPGMVHNGRVHCSFRQGGTVSGRLSCNTPNLQQVSARKDEYGLRMSFRPSAGCSLIVVDYASLEWLLATHCSQDPALLRIEADGLDPHAYTAMGVFAAVKGYVDAAVAGGTTLAAALKKVKEYYPAERDIAKTLNYALLYGAGPRTLARSMQTTVEEAARRREAWYTTYAGYAAWSAEVIETATSLTDEGQGYVKTLAGRKRHVDERKWDARARGVAWSRMTAPEKEDERLRAKMIRGKEERALVNGIIQGSGADLTNAAMIAISRDDTLRNLGYRLLLQVHDEIVGEAPTETAPPCFDRVVKHMCDAHKDKIRGVTIRASGGIGANWKEAK